MITPVQNISNKFKSYSAKESLSNTKTQAGSTFQANRTSMPHFTSPVYFCGDFNAPKNYVVGHKHSDTDSVVTSIAYAYLLKQLGKNFTPVAHERLNSETQYVLKKFNVKKPQIISDFIVKVNDVMNPTTDKNFLDENSTVSDLGKLITTGHRFLTVINSKNQKVTGMVTDKDVAKLYFATPKNIQYHYKYEAIKKALDAVVLCGEKQLSGEVKGNVFVGDSSLSTLSKKLTKNDLLILGDREDVLKMAIDKRVGCIVLSHGRRPSKEMLDMANKNKVLILSSEHDSRHIGKLIEQSIKINQIMDRYPITLQHDASLKDITNDVGNLPYRLYPIVDNSGKYLGTASKSELLHGIERKFVLVDHNSLKQSPEGIDGNEVVGVIDHHLQSNVHGNCGRRIDIKIGKEGSTSTKIALEYLLNDVSIPSNIAGILLCGILSDTDVLRSVTTTDEDKRMVQKLAKIANIDDISTLGKDLMRARSEEAYKASSHQALINDIKPFTSKVTGETVEISQVSVDNPKKFLELHADMLACLNAYDVRHRISGSMMMITSNSDEKYSLILCSDRFNELLNSKAKKLSGDVVKENCSLKTSLSNAIKRFSEASNQQLPARFDDVSSRKDEVQPFIYKIIDA